MVISQPGLAWEKALIGAEPRWTSEPSIEVMKRIIHEHLNISHDSTELSVTFFGKGAFKKLYTIRNANESYMMRVSLPVDPYWKTTSEVATLDFVRQKTDIPVPKIIASDASHDNELGFEWILMELMPGKPYADKWKTLPWAPKAALVKRLAQCSAELFRNPCEGIGGKRHVESPLKDEFEVGRIVSMPFFWEKRLEQNVPRGPYQRSRDWLAAHLCFPCNDSDLVLLKHRQDGIPQNSDEDELDDANAVKDHVNRLSLRLQLLFPHPDYDEAAETAPEQTVLCHDDINMSNILVDDDGNMTALVDWECLCASIMACLPVPWTSSRSHA